MKAISKDLGLDFDVNVLSDATAAIGICRRRGLGKIRHLAVADLWVQDRVRALDFILSKVPGSENTADIMTKMYGPPHPREASPRLGPLFEDGRAESAPELTRA